MNKKQSIWLIAVISSVLLIGGGLALIAVYGSTVGTIGVAKSITTTPTTWTEDIVAGSNTTVNVTVCNNNPTRRIPVAFNGSINPLNGGGNVEGVWYNATVCMLNVTTQIYNCPVENWNPTLCLTRPVIFQIAPAATSDNYTIVFNGTAI